MISLNPVNYVKLNVKKMVQKHNLNAALLLFEGGVDLRKYLLGSSLCMYQTQ